MKFNLGVVSRSFPERTDAEIADMLAKNGLIYTELCFLSKDFKYWSYNSRSDMSAVTDEDVARVCKIYQDKGVVITAIGVFTNLINPDEDERRANIEYFKRHIDWASQNNVPNVSTECGFTPHQRGVNTDRYEDDFQRIKDSLCELADYAAPKGVNVALEACVIDVVPSAKRCRDLLEQCQRQNLKVLLDPANYIANSSEEDMFKYLSKYVAYFHAKDRKVNDLYGRCVGDGDINWPYFFSLYRKYTNEVPVIMEYVKEDNWLEIAQRTKGFFEQSIELPNG